MKREQIKIGNRYTAKVNGKVVSITVKDISYMAYRGRKHLRFVCFNETTRRTVMLKSALKFIAELGQPLSSINFGERKTENENL